MRIRLVLMAALLCAAASVAVRGQAGAAPAGTEQREQIDFQKARSLFQKRQRGETLTADEEAYVRRAMQARRATQGPGRSPATGAREKVGLKPLSEMTADDRYKGEDGGLYGKGRNSPPESHAKAAAVEAARIRPLDGEGREAKDGKVVLLSISMSNATQEFSLFKQLADADAAKSPELVIVDGAQGGQAMAEWAPADARPWHEALRRIRTAGVTPQQVQAVWIKLANKAPRGELEEHGRTLERDTLAVVQNAKTRFPNLRIAYLSSRIYGGYAANSINPEPYAYESAYVVRWLIQDQIKGAPELSWAADKAKAPLLLWGPYLWADGVTPRAGDQLVWKREDLREDGTHPSQSGREKVAHMLLDFFKTDPTAHGWFVR